MESAGPAFLITLKADLAKKFFSHEFELRPGADKYLAIKMPSTKPS
jgi:hypothetical protein